MSNILEHMGRAIQDASMVLSKTREDVTGVKSTHEKLSQAVALSGEVIDYWHKLLELQKAVPCPVNLTEISNALFVLIALVGKQEGVDVMKAVYHETKQRVAEGIGVFTKGEEKHRLMWISIPFWFNLGLFGYFEKRGCVFPLSDYTQYIWGTTKMHDFNWFSIMLFPRSL